MQPESDQNGQHQGHSFEQLESASTSSTRDRLSEKLAIDLASEIEKLVESGHDYITAIVEFARNNEIDIEDIAPHIVGPLKEKVRLCGEEDGRLKKSSAPAFIFD